MAGGRARRGVFDVLFAATLTGTAGTAGSFAPDLASAPAVGATRLFFGGIGLLLALPLAGGDRTRAIRLLRTSGGVTAALMAAWQFGYYGPLKEKDRLAFEAMKKEQAEKEKAKLSA